MSGSCITAHKNSKVTYLYHLQWTQTWFWKNETVLVCEQCNKVLDLSKPNIQQEMVNSSNWIKTHSKVKQFFTVLNWIAVLKWLKHRHPGSCWGKGSKTYDWNHVHIRKSLNTYQKFPRSRPVKGPFKGPCGALCCPCGTLGGLRSRPLGPPGGPPSLGAP